MLVDPMNQASYCCKQLLSSFKLRGLFQAEEETIYREEYITFINEHHHRRIHPEMQYLKLLIADTIDFVSSQEALRSRRHLTRIFHLSCLVMDEHQFIFPAVKFGSVKTDDTTSAMFDMLFPHAVIPRQCGPRVRCYYVQFFYFLFSQFGANVWVYRTQQYLSHLFIYFVFICCCFSSLLCLSVLQSVKSQTR